MRFHSRRLIVAAAATLALAVAAPVASANRLSVNELNFRINWSRLTFENEITRQRIICNLSLTGSFHSRTMAKVIRSQIGHVTSGAVGTCERGAATVLTTTPWTVTYNGFTGALPQMTSIRLWYVGAALQMQDELTCLFTTQELEPLASVVEVSAAGQARGIRVEAALPVDLDNPDFLCTMALDGSFTAGSGTVSAASGGLLFFRLI